MRINRDHLGSRIDVWSGQENWFWLVVNPRRDGGIIGSAATEADAVREACVAIEERFALGGGDAPFPHLVNEPPFESMMAHETCRESRTSSLERLAEYVATV